MKDTQKHFRQLKLIVLIMKFMTSNQVANSARFALKRNQQKNIFSRMKSGNGRAFQRRPFSHLFLISSSAFSIDLPSRPFIAEEHLYYNSSIVCSSSINSFRSIRSTDESRTCLGNHLVNSLADWIIVLRCGSSIPISAVQFSPERTPVFHSLLHYRRTEEEDQQPRGTWKRSPV